MDEGEAIRGAGREALAAALRAARRETLARFDAWVAAGALEVPQRPTLNPPLWELGHVGWFQERWIARNPQRSFGIACDPDAPLAPPQRDGADALYDSSRVAHATRWSLPLPDADATRADLDAQLATTLALLAGTPESDDALYVFRLALLHEDMHAEAAVTMQNALGVPLRDPRLVPPRLAGPRRECRVPEARTRIGHGRAGFAFDNELRPHEVDLPAFGIDSRVLSWAEFLPFVDAGGYREPRWWSDAGRAWLRETGAAGPVAPGDADEPASRLSLHEAEAWCAWAGRRLPSEAEWEHAARTLGPGFAWGAVWEWTASAFAPYPGFVPHPYRDYSQPWFDGRPVLRGASWATPPRLAHRNFRNFFVAGRTDIIAGFRTCSLGSIRLRRATRPPRGEDRALRGPGGA